MTQQRFVVATSGHVDHGKSTLVRALTGIEPDRWDEEQRRGLTIDLGFAWTTLPSGRGVAFVDVPGHERFLGNMLAGLGPAPVVLFVVAADQGWQPQSTDHLAAARALDLRHGVVAITRTDLAPDAVPEVAAEVRNRLAGSGLAEAPIVAVSGRTGAGLDELRAALDAVLAQVPAADPAAPVRMWIDRSFPISGAGTVVTGTLADGRIAKGDEFALASRSDDELVTVRGIQCQGETVTAAAPVSRAAVNLRNVPVAEVQRGDALLTPGAWWRTALVDARRVSGVDLDALPEQLVVHVGTAAVPAHLRPFGADHVRIRLAHELPLRIGDRMVLRDPGERSVVGGVQVLDVDPPALRRRGAGARRASVLAAMSPEGSLELEVRRRGAVLAADLRRMGVAVPEGPVREGAGAAEAAPGGTRMPSSQQAARGGSRTPSSTQADAVRGGSRTPPSSQVGTARDDARGGAVPARGTELPASVIRIGERLVAKPALAAWAKRLREAVEADAAADPLSPGLTRDAAVDALRLPDAALVPAVVRLARLEVAAGRIRRPGVAADLGPAERGVAELERRLGERPFAAPEADDLQALRLGAKELATAERVGRLLRVADGVVLLPSAPATAASMLARLPQPFTASEARQALGTSRRVMIPLLELLDRRGLTRRLPDNRREVVPR